MSQIPVDSPPAGPLVLAYAQDSVAIFTRYDMEPGEQRIGRVKLANPEPRPVRLRLMELQASCRFRPGELTLSIETLAEGDEIYEGDIGRFPALGIDLGPFAPGEERTYLFAARLDAGASNLAKDRGAGATYEWRVERVAQSPIRPSGLTSEGGIFGERPEPSLAHDFVASR